MRILLIEDDEALREGISDLLAHAGHEVESAADGRAGLDLGLREAFDLVVLDLMLPHVTGQDVCQRLRVARPGIAIIMVTALASQAHRVAGLRLGADDYLAKPFAPEELLLRVAAIGRRIAGAAPAAERIEVDGLVLDLARLSLQRGEESTSLTPREAGILRWLHRHRARAVSRAELLENVWGVPATLETRTVDAAIVKLRQKIERDPRAPRIVVSVQGVGYKWGPQ